MCSHPTNAPTSNKYQKHTQKKLYQNNEGVDDVKKHARAKFDNKENMQGGKKGQISM